MPRTFPQQPTRISQGTTSDGKSEVATGTTFRKWGAQPDKIKNR